MKILVTGAWEYTNEQINEIRALGHEVTEMKNEKAEPPCNDFEGIICNGFFLFHNIKHYPQLKYIQLTSAGFDRIPMDYVRDNNIQIRNARGVYSIPMAEYSVLKVLEIYKDSKGFFQKQINRNWSKNRNLQELFEKTVCIVGCGNVGTECAKRFSAFGCKVVGVDCCVTNWFDGIVSLENGFETADIVILTLPLNKETRGIIDSNLINLLRPGSVVVNISRGSIVSKEALICRNDVFFVLDVFDEEPLPPENELWNKQNIIITPHNSFVGTGNNKRLAEVIMENLRSLM